MKRNERTLASALWAGTQDVALLGGVFVVIAGLQRLRRGQAITIPTGRTLTLAAAILLVVWAATVVACKLGASTAGDSLGGPSSGFRSRVPGTLAVATITGFVTFIALLFAGLVN